MFRFSRAIIGTNLANSAKRLQQSKLSLARYATIPPAVESGGGDGENSQKPKPPKASKILFSAIASAIIGGTLGYACKTIYDEAACAAGDDCNSEKKCEDSECLHRMDKEEQTIANANHELEKSLKDIKGRSMETTEKALKIFCETTKLNKEFMEKAYCAIEEINLESSRFEEVWCEVQNLASKRCERYKDGILKAQCAWELLCRLREIIQKGKACKFTTCNPLLITAEEFLLCAERELVNGKAEMDCVQSESRIVEQYRNIVEDFRQDLKAEMESILTSNPECKNLLSNNECNMVLTHAYKKILRIQKEISVIQHQEECAQSPIDGGPKAKDMTKSVCSS